MVYAASGGLIAESSSSSGRLVASEEADDCLKEKVPTNEFAGHCSIHKHLGMSKARPEDAWMKDGMAGCPGFLDLSSCFLWLVLYVWKEKMALQNFPESERENRLPETKELCSCSSVSLPSLCPRFCSSNTLMRSLISSDSCCSQVCIVHLQTLIRHGRGLKPACFIPRESENPCNTIRETLLGVANTQCMMCYRILSLKPI